MGERVEMIRENDLLFLLVDGERVSQRKNGQWTASDPSWSVQRVKLWGHHGQTWDAFEFSFEGEPFDTLFYLDKDGNPHEISVSDSRMMPSA
jgi:hypothetical protein